MSHDVGEQWEKDYNLQSQICGLERRVDKLIDDNAKIKKRLLVLYKDRRMRWWERWFGKAV